MTITADTKLENGKNEKSAKWLISKIDSLYPFNFALMHNAINTKVLNARYQINHFKVIYQRIIIC